MKNPNVEFCSLIESRTSQTIKEINKTHSIFDSDKLHSELRILEWIFYQVCKDQQKTLAMEFVGCQTSGEIALDYASSPARVRYFKGCAKNIEHG